MKLGACNKNKIVLEKEKFQKCTDFCENAFEKISSPPLSQKLKLKKIMVYDGYQKRLGNTESTQRGSSLLC